MADLVFIVDHDRDGDLGDGVEAVALTGSLRPDFVLMDVRLPGLNGIEATRRIRSLNPAPVVIGLTVHWTPALEAAMSKACASACRALLNNSR